MAGIPDHVIDQIQDRVDIVEIIGGYIPLKKAGRNFRANCPFHHEKTPSFMVSQDKQIFHCFGCGAGGNVFNFIMKYERLEFPEVIRMLAQKTGVPIPDSAQESSAEAQRSNKLYAANELAVGFFQKNLKEDRAGKAAYTYLTERGLTPETISAYRLGFAVSAWEGLINFAKLKGAAPDVLEKAGLSIARSEGGHFDRFRNRIMFPILDMKSRVLGFGGRIFLKEDTGPKYMNSPETSIYNKGRNLYGLNVTWQHIRDADQVIIVEGYLDLIVPFQFGIKNIVASLGTSLTEDQIRLIRRYTKNVVIIFDPDKAGEIATLRSLDLLIQEDMGVSVVRLPEGFDPDSFARKYGAQGFKKQVTEAKNLFEYKMSVMLSKYNKNSLEDKARIVEEMLVTISKVPNAVLKSGYIKMLSDSLSIDEEAIRQELKKVKGDYGPARPAQVARDADAPAGAQVFSQAEKLLTALLIDDNNCIKPVMEKLSLEELKSPVIRKVVEVLFKCAGESKSITPGKLICHLGNAEAHKFIPELMDSVETVIDRQKTLEDCIVKIKQDNLKDKLNRLQVEIALAQSKVDEDRISRLIAECNTLLGSIKFYEEKNKEAQKQAF